MELSCWKIHTEFKNQKTKSVFSYNAVGMAKLFAKFFQNKTYPEELYRFTYNKLWIGFLFQIQFD